MPIYHRTTDNRHFECAGLPWWSFGSRRARIVCRVSPIRFVPSLSMVLEYKRQNLPWAGGMYLYLFWCSSGGIVAHVNTTTCMCYNCSNMPYLKISSL
jgi:hypothetical protein